MSDAAREVNSPSDGNETRQTTADSAPIGLGVSAGGRRRDVTGHEAAARDERDALIHELMEESRHLKEQLRATAERYEKTAATLRASADGTRAPDEEPRSSGADIAERKRAEQALHESEEKYRTLFDLIDEGFCNIEVLCDENDRPCDHRFLEVNPAFARLTGIENAKGKRMREIAPGHEQFWLEIYDRVTLAGEHARFEYRAEQLGRWFDVYALRVGGPEMRRVAVLFNDITARKRHESNLAFLAETSDLFAPLATADEIMRLIGERLARYLGLSRCGFAIVDDPADRLTNIYEWRRDETIPSMAGELRISAFLNEEGRRRYAAGEISVVNDVRNDPRMKTPAELFDGARVGSVIDAPHLKNGRWQFLLSACRSEVSEWRGDEIELVRELAARIYIRLERAHAEEALRESEERTRIAVEAAELGTWEWDLTNDRVYWNGRHFLLFGMRPRCNPIKLDDFFAHIHPDDRASVAERLNKAIADKTVFEAEFRVRLDTGETRWMDDYGRVVEEAHDGRAARMSGVIFDITGRKRAEKALRRLNERLEARVAERTIELMEMNAELQAEVNERLRIEGERRGLLRRLAGAQEDERRRIAREMHDQFGQQLTALLLKLNKLKEDCGDRKELRDQVETAETITRQLDSDVDFLVWELRPTALDDLGLQAALTNYAQGWSQHFGVPVDLHAGATREGRLTSEIETVLYRVTQEALNNVAKHARASGVGVVLERRADYVTLVVEDDGLGFDVEKVSGAGDKSLGLAGMRERAALVGGEVVIESRPGAGTTVIVRVPTAPS